MAQKGHARLRALFQRHADRDGFGRTWESYTAGCLGVLRLPGGLADEPVPHTAAEAALVERRYNLHRGLLWGLLEEALMLRQRDEEPPAA